MPINPPAEPKPVVEQTVAKAAATARTYSPLLAVALAVAGASLPAGLEALALVLVILAGGLAMRGAR